MSGGIGTNPYWISRPSVEVSCGVLASTIRIPIIQHLDEFGMKIPLRIDDNSFMEEDGHQRMLMLHIRSCGVMR